MSNHFARFIAAVAVAIVLFACCSRAHAGTITNCNTSPVTSCTAGAASAPISVSTNTVLFPADGRRTAWTIYIEGTTPARCTFGTYSHASGQFSSPSAATSTTGFEMPAGVLINETVFAPPVPYAGNVATTADNAQIEVDCASTSGTISIDTEQERLGSTGNP